MDTDHETTGARAEVDVTVDVPAEQFWKVITDIARTGEQSPECFHSAWLDGASGPAADARFEAGNRFPGGLVTQVLCVVTAADPPRTFGWDVYGANPPDDAPLAHWHYELRPAAQPGRTVVHQTFTHGEGDSGVRIAQRADPEQAGAVLEQRLMQLRENMTATIRAMERSARTQIRPA